MICNILGDTAAKVAIPLGVLGLLVALVQLIRLYFLSKPKGWPDYFLYGAQFITALLWIITQIAKSDYEPICRMLFIFSFIGTKQINIKQMQHYYPKESIFVVKEGGEEHKIDMKPIYTRAQRFQWIGAVLATIIGGIWLVSLYMDNQEAKQREVIAADNAKTEATKKYEAALKRAAQERQALRVELGDLSKQIADLKKSPGNDSAIKVLQTKMDGLLKQGKQNANGIKKVIEEVKPKPNYKPVVPRGNKIGYQDYDESDATYYSDTLYVRDF